MLVANDYANARQIFFRWCFYSDCADFLNGRCQKPLLKQHLLLVAPAVGLLMGKRMLESVASHGYGKC